MAPFAWIFGILITLLAIEGQVPIPDNHYINYSMEPPTRLGIQNPN